MRVPWRPPGPFSDRARRVLVIHAAVVTAIVTVVVALVYRWTVECLVVSDLGRPAAQVSVNGQRRDQAEQQYAQQPPTVALRNRLTTHDHRL